MKLNNILTEDIKAEKQLNAIATEMLRALYKHASNQLSDEDIRVPPEDVFNLGKIKTIVDSKILSNFYNRLGNLQLEYTFNGPVGENKKSDAEFDWGGKRILIYFPLNKALRPIYTSSKIHSLMVHELRHALDYSLSKGKAFTDKSVKGASEPPRNQKKYGEYERLSNEVNARASQAMLLAKKYIVKMKHNGKDIDNILLKKIVLRSLREMRLTRIFQSQTPNRPFDNKTFRQLFKRVLKYSEDVLQEI